MMKIGAHVSISGGLPKAIERAIKIGANTIQIFASAPRNFYSLPFPHKDVELFKEEARRNDISPIFLHAIYLINLTTPNPELRKKTIDSLNDYQNKAYLLNCQGTIFHLGSRKELSLEEAIKNIEFVLQKVLESSPKNCSLIIENNAGMGGCMGAKFEEIERLIKDLKDPRLKVCLDTAHALAAGYAINTKEGLNETLIEFDGRIGLDRLVVIHANDSKVPLAANRDLHENIGKGYIGISGFDVIINNEHLKDLPFILEVPGFAKEGPDKENIELLKSLVK